MHQASTDKHTPLLRCKDMRVIRSQFAVHFDFSLEQGSLMSILGPSGAGKSSILHCIAGFISPEQGDLQFEGHSILSLPPNKRGMGLVFQDYALFPHMSVFQNIAYGLRIAQRPQSEIKARVGTLMELLHISRYADSFIHEISGGEQQRVALARALAPQPKLLLLDEPLGALDVALRSQLKNEIRNIQKTLDLASIYVTHDQSEALSISDKIAVMDKGQIIQIASPKEIYRRPRTKFVAQFIGECNFIEGTLIQRTQSELIFDTDIGRLGIPKGEQATQSFEKSKRYTLCIRPEHVNVHETYHSGFLPARVVSEEFRGNQSILTLRVGKSNFLALNTTTSPLRKEVSIEITRAHIL